MYLHNLKQDPDPVLISKLLHLQETKISVDMHRNIDNYQNICEEFNKFDSFELLLNDDRQIVAFSGMYNNGSFPDNCARICNRTYYNPDFRSKARRVRWSEDYFVPYEIDQAKQLGYEYVFISIELFLRRRALIDIIKYLEKNYSWKWKLENRMFNTCRQHNDNGDYIGLNPSHKCYQNVCYTQLVDKPLKPFSLPSISIDEYNKVYSNKQHERLRD